MNTTTATETAGWAFSSAMKPVIRRIPHAAHYMYEHPAKGHDLIELDVTSEKRPAAPLGFDWHSGYVKNGRQHWVFTKRAPLSSGTCARCPKAVR